MEVTFETTKGRRLTIEIWYFSTVRQMKEYVLKYAGIPVESQRLFFRGTELEDDLDTEHYSILEGSHVLIVLRDDAAAGVIHVVASAPALGRTVALEVDPTCTVARLKEILQERTDGALPAARAAVFLGKAEMKDDKAVADYTPPAGGMETEVRVVVRPATPDARSDSKKRKRMSVEVKWGAGTATLEVSDMDAVKELRAELGSAAPHLLLPDDGGYCFRYKENVMEEERTLRWHDVKNGDTIEIFNGGAKGEV